MTCEASEPDWVPGSPEPGGGAGGQSGGKQGEGGNARGGRGPDLPDLRQALATGHPPRSAPNAAATSI